MHKQLWSCCICLSILATSCIKEQDGMRYSPTGTGNPDTGNPENKAPVAVIIDEVDTTYLPYGRRVVMDGSLSSDPEKAKLRFGWRQLSGPVPLIVADTSQPLCVYDILETGTYVFELTVTDPGGVMAKDTATRVVLADPNCSADWTDIQPQLELVSTSPLMYFWPAIRTTGSKLLFAGGSIADPNDPDQWEAIHTRDVHIFDILSKTWSLDSLSSARSPLAASYGDMVAFVGGMERNDSGGISKRIDIYNAATGRWKSLDMPRHAWMAGVAIAGNQLIIAGGADKDFYPSAQADIYDLQNETWTVRFLGAARTNMAVVNNGQRVFFGGGVSNSSTISALSSVVDVYTPSTRQWTTGSFDEPRAFMLGVAAGPYLIWAGGRYGSGNQPTGRVDIQDLSAQKTGQDCLLSLIQSQEPGVKSLALDDQTVCFVYDKLIYFYQPGLRKWKVGTLDKLLQSIFVHQGKLYGVLEEGINGRARYSIYQVRY